MPQAVSFVPPLPEGYVGAVNYDFSTMEEILTIHAPSGWMVQDRIPDHVYRDLSGSSAQTIRNAHFEGLLTSLRRAEVRSGPGPGRVQIPPYVPPPPPRVNDAVPPPSDWRARAHADVEDTQQVADNFNAVLDYLRDRHTSRVAPRRRAPTRGGRRRPGEARYVLPLPG